MSPSFVQLLIGRIYCPKRQSSCDFAAKHRLNPDAGMKIWCCTHLETNLNPNNINFDIGVMNYDEVVRRDSSQLVLSH